MGKKWVKVDPALIIVGDRVKLVDEYTDRGVKHRDECRFKVTDVVVGGVNDYAALSEGRTWYVRKPKPAKPPTRPDEPPVGTFFRVERTGGRYQRSSEESYYSAGYSSLGVVSLEWDDITEPGDTITLLDLVERDA